MELTLSRMQSRERALIVAALVVVTLLAWSYLALPGAMGPMAELGALNTLALNMVMWAVMMVAMMLPGAGPMIVTYTRVHQQRRSSSGATVPTWFFVAGYLAVWTGFGIAAALLQWSLHQSALLTSAMGKTGPLLAGTLLITAGVFQFSNLKEACLNRCRSPLGFIMTEWREGPYGAFIMGSRHGVYCTGCCWALMLLMFVGGVMSLVWMAGLTVYFLAEKLLSGARQVTRITGLLLIGAGITLLVTRFGL